MMVFPMRNVDWKLTNCTFAQQEREAPEHLLRPPAEGPCAPRREVHAGPVPVPRRPRRLSVLLPRRRGLPAQRVHVRRRQQQWQGKYSSLPPSRFEDLPLRGCPIDHVQSHEVTGFVRNRRWRCTSAATTAATRSGRSTPPATSST